MTPLRLLRISTIAISAFIGIAFAAFTWADHRASDAQARESLREVVRLMEEHTRAAMLVSALQLNRAAELVGDRPLSALAGSVEDWGRLKTIMADVPHADSFWIFDARARLVLSTLRPSGVAVDASDREYFTAVRDGARLFISPRIWGKVYGGYYLAMSRPLENPDGSLKGVAQFSIKESYFSDFYRTLRPLGGASFSIVKSDGSLIARWPEPPEGSRLDEERAKTVIGSLPEGGTVIRRMRSGIDGADRLYALRRVAGYPLVVAAGLPASLVFEGFAERTFRNGALAAMALAAFLLISGQLGGAMRREETALVKTRQLLAEKEVLFQEIHHRVKNNLQIISSFLTMQSIKAGDQVTADAFQQALDRIHSMGLVHQILYEQHEAAEVSMDAYLRALATSIGQSYGAEDRAITIAVETDGARLGLDRAVPLALLANEALTNAMKHAFPAGRAGRVEMRLERRDSRLAFTVRDDGVGMPDRTAGKAAGSGLGMHILRALAAQLDGTATFTVDSGTALHVSFPA